MTKNELIRRVSDKTGISQKQVGKVLEKTLGEISNALDAGEKVTLKDFGVFSIIETKERKGVNPITKEPMVIESKERVKFKPYDKIRVYSMKN